MNRYGKTPNIFKRDPDTHKLTDEFSSPALRSLANIRWRFTEKIDGTNIRMIWHRINPYAFEFRGRSDKATLPSGFVDRMNDVLDYESISKGCLAIPYKPEVVCIYGEGFGAGIQKGGSYSKQKQFAAFDIKVDGSWLPSRVVDQLVNEWQLWTVPTMFYGTLDVGVLAVHRGMLSVLRDGYAEGLVARPLELLHDWRNRRIQCKIKHCDLYQGSDK